MKAISFEELAMVLSLAGLAAESDSIRAATSDSDLIEALNQASSAAWKERDAAWYAALAAARDAALAAAREKMGLPVAAFQREAQELVRRMCALREERSLAT